MDCTLTVVDVCDSFDTAYADITSDGIAMTHKVAKAMSDAAASPTLTVVLNGT